MDDAMTIGRLLDEALRAYGALATVAEDVEDEWSYVTDLRAAWQARLEAVIGERGAEAAGQAERAAIERLVDEVGRIRDPHRAIDWLSTFPQVALVALGERP